MKNLAPIGLSAYSRIYHLERTVAALKNNLLAEQSNLYIFSDAPKEGDVEKVKAVREFLHSIDGFNHIEIIERKQNNRVRNNRDGIDYLLDAYGKIIFLEEDVVTAQGFLKFMNEALNYYEDNENVFSISGYAPPIGAEKFSEYDVYVLPRFDAWGFGIWKNRYDTIEYFSIQELRKLLKCNKKKKILDKYMGEDSKLLLQLEADKVIDALDVKAIYRQLLTEKITIFPKKSLVINIGNDGSGIHCSATEKYNAELWDKKIFIFTDNLEINDRIADEHREFRKLNGINKYLLIAKNLRIYPLIIFMKKCLDTLKNISKKEG